MTSEPVEIKVYDIEDVERLARRRKDEPEVGDCPIMGCDCDVIRVTEQPTLIDRCTLNNNVFMRLR